MPKEKLLRPKQTAEMLGCGVSTLWRWAKTLDNFPQPKKISSKITVWKESDLLSWIEQKFSKDEFHA